MNRLKLHAFKDDFAEIAYAFGQCELESWRDYALVPWWLLRWFLAYCWSPLWVCSLNLNCWLKQNCWTIFKFTRWILPTGGGRHVDPFPVICERCLWAGARRWTVHTYTGGGEEGDVEACDECPRCGNEL
jgi:hypothetical protein